MTRSTVVWRSAIGSAATPFPKVPSWEHPHTIDIRRHLIRPRLLFCAARLFAGVVIGFAAEQVSLLSRH